MKAAVLFVLVIACQKHDDSVTTNTTSTTSTSAVALPSAIASVTPLATTEPSASATASAAPIRDAGATTTLNERKAAELAKQVEGMHLQMLGAYNGTAPLTSVDVATVVRG